MSVLKIKDENGNIIEIPAFKGDKGFSAYEIAVKNGFDGTEDEWLLSLKGEKGDTGAQGADGEVTKEELKKYAVPIFENGAPTEVIYAQSASQADGVYGGKPITIYVDFVKDNDQVAEASVDNKGCIPMRNKKGNLYTGIPTETMEAANKKYVDDKLGDIEALLGGI